MSDFSPAAGLEPIESSFSRRVFSSEMIRRVAMIDGGLLDDLLGESEGGKRVFDSREEEDCRGGVVKIG